MRNFLHMIYSRKVTSKIVRCMEIIMRISKNRKNSLNKRRVSLIIAAAVVMFGLSACTDDNKEPEKNSTEIDAPQESAKTGVIEDEMKGYDKAKPIIYNEGYNIYSGLIGAKNSKIALYRGDNGDQMVYVVIDGEEISANITASENEFRIDDSADIGMILVKEPFELGIVYTNTLGGDGIIGKFNNGEGYQEVEMQLDSIVTYPTEGLSREEVQKSIQTIRDHIINKEWDQVADYVEYPLIVNENGEITKITDKKEFLATVNDAYFSEEFLAVLEKEDCIFPFYNYQGYMIGNGAIWFNEKDNELKIFSINK